MFLKLAWTASLLIRKMLDLFSPSIMMSEGFPFPWSVRFLVISILWSLYVPGAIIISSPSLALMILSAKSVEESFNFSLFVISRILSSLVIVLLFSNALTQLTDVKIINRNITVKICLFLIYFTSINNYLKNNFFSIYLFVI